jgi:hypothetical protein
MPRPRPIVPLCMEPISSGRTVNLNIMLTEPKSVLLVNLKLFNCSVPIVSDSDCQTSLQATRLGPTFRLENSFLCAGKVQI